MTDDSIVLKQVNASGFPFQLGVEHSVQTSFASHGWSVLSRECAWATPHAQGFIDLVLTHNEHSTFRLVVECKRVRALDARQLQWVFLVPGSQSTDAERASSFEVEANFRGDKAGELRIWDSVSIYPTSPESEFCVLQGDEPSRQPLLERLAAQLLESVEGLAQEEFKVRATEDRSHLRLFMFPAIVTNAKLAVCRFDPASVDLDKGMIEDAEFSEVPLIRFRKSLAKEFPLGVFYNVGFANKARERTVLVINAAALPDILAKWQMGPAPGRDYATREFLRR